MKPLSRLLKDFYSYQMPANIREYAILGIGNIQALEKEHKVSLKDSIEFGIKFKKIQNFIVKTFFLLLGITLIPAWIFYIISVLKEFSFGSLFIALFLMPLLALLTLLCFLFFIMMFYLTALMTLQEILPIKSLRKIKLLDKVNDKLDGFKKLIYKYERDIERICKYDPEATWIKQSNIKSSPDVLAFWIIDLCKKPELTIFKKESNTFYKHLLMRIAFIIDDYKLKKIENASAVFGMPINAKGDLEKIANKYIKDKDARESYWDFYKNALTKQAFYLERFESAIKK
jgi:hypothetical protein